MFYLKFYHFLVEFYSNVSKPTYYKAFYSVASVTTKGALPAINASIKTTKISL